MRSVFISYAANDPDWPADQVRDLATVLQQSGAAVLLDQFHQKQVGRRLSIDEWRQWMRKWVHEADHILCLASPRYLKAAERDVDDPAGYGVAFESLRLIHQLYENKGHNDGRIVVARRGGVSVKTVVPEDFRMDCPLYELPLDREDLMRDLTRSTGGSTPDSADETKPDSGSPNGEKLGSNDLKRSGFQTALNEAIQRTWTDPAVAQHVFFVRWAIRAKLSKLTGDAIYQHCLTCPRPNRALIDIADVVAELDWPTTRTITGVHSRVVELVELMTMVLCERRIQQDIEGQKPLASVAPAGDLLVLPMNNRLAACMVAAAWLKLHVKLVLDESGKPTALNLLSDLPPQEFGWTDARQAVRAEVMAHLNHMRGGDRHCSASVRDTQLSVVKRRGVPGDADLKDHLEAHVERGGARPAFGFQHGANVGLDGDTRVWLRDTLEIGVFAFDPAAVAAADARFEELQGFLLQHLEEIITRVHAGSPAEVNLEVGDSTMSKRTKVFISYSHADKKKWLPLFQKKLAVLEKEGLLDLWDDTRIQPGDDWYAEIDRALKDCQIALLLISDEFLSSKFIQRKEMVDLLEKHKGGGLRLYPVLLRDCLWEVNPHLKRLQIKMTRTAKPLEDCKPAERNAVLTEIGRDLLKAMQPDAAGAV